MEQYTDDLELEMDEVDVLVDSNTFEDEEDEMPTITHGYLQWQIIALIRNITPPTIGVYPPVTFQGKYRNYSPDVVVYPKPDNPLIEEHTIEPNPPLLAVEITSPGQTIRTMVAKCKEMLDSGVLECWIVEPANQTITVCLPTRMFALHRGEMLESTIFDESISLDDIFSA